MTRGPVRIRVDDTVVTRLTHDEVLALIVDRADAAGARPLALCSANLDHLHHFRPGRSRLGDDVDWVTIADGAPVAHRGGALAGTHWPRVTGADLLPDVIRACAEHGLRIGFFGGTAESHAALDEVLRATLPDLPIAGYWAPERAELTDPAAGERVLGELRAARVSVLVVGLGKPRQEQWIDEWGPRAGAAVLLPFGAAADFLAGRVDRAPALWQRLGIEWLYRLRQEPRRLARRYLVQGPPALAHLRSARLVTDGAADRRGVRS